MSDNKIFEQLSDTYLLALCIWAEARNQGLEGMQAVGSVILNRASRPGWWGGSTGSPLAENIKSVILKPYQFSCLNENDPQREKMIKVAQNYIDAMLADPALRECFWIAKGLIETQLRSNVAGATHYHTTAIAPNWKNTMKQVATIKDHVFYV